MRILSRKRDPFGDSEPTSVREFKAGDYDPFDVKERVYYAADLSLVDPTMDNRLSVADKKAANLISSEVAGEDGMHSPVLDLDFPAKLVKSTTPGHHHLFLDVKMTWEEYAFLLIGLERAHVIEPGYLYWALQRKATFVRKPGIKKQPGDHSS